MENLKFKNKHFQKSGPKLREEHFFGMILDVNILGVIIYLNNWIIQDNIFHLQNLKIKDNFKVEGWNIQAQESSEVQINYSKLAIETLEQGVKYVQS